jgi:hypothetical protein
MYIMQHYDTVLLNAAAAIALSFDKANNTVSMAIAPMLTDSHTS